jgi:hypothetical protein
MSDRAVVGVYITGINGPIHTIGANLPYVMHTSASKRVLDLI